MSLLDNLDLEVDRIKAEQAEQERARAEQQLYYSQHLKPVMVRARTYLKELVEKLQLVGPDIRPVYPLIARAPHDVTLQQKNYRCRADDGQDIRRVDLFCECHLPNPFEIDLGSQAKVQRQADLLQEYDFPHHQKNRLDDFYEVRGARFIFEGPLLVHVRLRAAAEDRCIYIELRNLESRPLSKYKFSPEAVDEQLLERLARVLVREERLLVESEVDGSTRKDLQEQLLQERLQQHRDMQAALAEREVYEESRRNQTILDKLKGALADKLAR